MKEMLLACLFLLSTVPCIEAAMPDPKVHQYWVFFIDKADVQKAEMEKEIRISPRSLQRRKKAGAPEYDRFDTPVTSQYLEILGRQGLTPRIVSRWMNAASVDIPDSLLDAVKSYPFVRAVQRVASSAAHPPPRGGDEERLPKYSSAHVLDYGESYAQNRLLHVPEVHDLGITGKGVLVGLIDTGFDYEDRSVFSSLDVVGAYDFYWDDDETANEEGDASNQHNHGTEVLSAIGGFEEGRLIGTAYGASFALAKTEWVPVTDYAVEEDYWIAAIEWLEGMGAEVVSSSLVYSNFVDKDDYTLEDLDGDSSWITRAADIAASKGVVVVNAAGNQDVWPYIEFPADGDSVIAVGAVTESGNQSWFSAEGPTADGRFKPDVVAMGSGVYVVYPPAQDIFYFRNGTSFACPQVAGVCALILEAHPELSAMQVRDAVRNTADRADHPDNRYGWGLVNAYEAVFYHGMIFTRFESYESPVEGIFSLEMDVFAKEGVDDDAVIVHYIDDEGRMRSVHADALDAESGTRYLAQVFRESTGSLRFYVEARDASGRRYTGPIGAPDLMYSMDSPGDNTVAVMPNVPESLMLYHNYPNPFNETTTVFFELNDASRVLLRVLDRIGREVTLLYDGRMAPGYKRFEWNGRSADGRPVSSGVYFCELRTDASTRMVKMILVK